MSTLAKALNAETVLTENGAKAYASTNSKVLDFFYLAPASRGKNVRGSFAKALIENEDLAIRALLWLRDVRQGAGERQTFRDLIKYLTSNNQELATKVLARIPELGRFDDLETFFGTGLEKLAAVTWLNAMSQENALAFKWAPRKDKKGARPLRKVLNMNEKAWRKFVVANSDTVEQKMCARAFEDINFEQLPSMAMARYGKSFAKHSTAFAVYKAALEKGEVKVNAGAIFPHDIAKSCMRGDAVVASEQWKALPDYFEGSKYKNVLPVVDVSPSMNCTVSGSTSAMEVALSLGIYCSERAEGAFKNMFMTFSESPTLETLSGNLSDKLNQLRYSKWGMSTNFESVFGTILKAAKLHNVPAHEMPEVLLVPSDMQFNCMKGGHALPTIAAKFKASGYELPKIVFWQMCARAGGIPVTKDDTGVAIVSGFSPSILKAVLSGEIDPEAVMLRTLNVERYDLV